MAQLIDFPYIACSSADCNNLQLQTVLCGFFYIVYWKKVLLSSVPNQMMYSMTCAWFTQSSRLFCGMENLNVARLMRLIICGGLSMKEFLVFWSED